MNTTIYSITVDDVQSVADYHIGRPLTERELEFFAHKFSMDDWTEVVRDYIDYTLEEVKEE